MEQICRICLQAGADLPIFQEDVKEQSVKIKIYECLHDEVKDTEGYPRNICTRCNSTLDAMYKFIETYRVNAQWLERTHYVKLQFNNELEVMNKIDFDEDALSVTSESDLTLADIKIECNIDFDSKVDMDILNKPFLIERKSQDETMPKVAKKEKNKKLKALFSLKEPQTKEKKKINRDFKQTNSIATSLLEGAFRWSDMKWSYASQPEQQKPALKTHREKVGEITKRLLPKKKKPKSEKNRLCDLCGMVFQDQHKLNIHIKMKHNFVPVKCDELGCTKTCSSEKNLISHKARKHSTTRNFICAVCSKSFAMLGDLNHHMRLHKENYKKKRFQCSLCDKNFSAKKCLEIHERSVHTGDRPAVCSVCDSAFFHDDYLKEHMRLHTGETPFHCPVCGRGYAQRCNMKSHLKQHRVTELDRETLAKMKPNYLKLLKY